VNAQPGADAIDALTATAERDGCAPLPALTQADLCALGAADKALLCQRTWDWWLGLGERGRQQATAGALELLAFRKLILPARRRGQAAPVPELGLILAARSSPEPLVTCQIPGQDATANPRFFGMAQRDTGLRVLVCELLTGTPSGPGDSAEFGTILSYALVTPAHAAKMLVTWARTASGPAAGKAPAVDIFVHGAGGRLALDRYEIARDGRAFDVRRPATGLPPQRLDEMLVAQLITAALTRGAR